MISVRKSGLLAFVACLVVFSLPAAGQQGYRLSGKWATRLGVVRLKQKGQKVTARLIWVSPACKLKKGQVAFEGVLLEDSLAGKWRYCLKGGKKCNGEGWAPMVMLVARGGKVLSGAAHFPKTACRVGGKGKGDGVVARRLKPRPRRSKRLVAQGGSKGRGAGKTRKVASSATSGSGRSWLDENGRPMEEEVAPVDPARFAANLKDWQSAMEQGAGALNAGFFERARRFFKRAIELDPTRPEAYNGVGVTYYARSDYSKALEWYKKALETDPNFGDAFYNMACIYALQGKKELAFRYLGIAAANGYAEADAMRADKDLENLRSDPRFDEIIRKMASSR